MSQKDTQLQEQIEVEEERKQCSSQLPIKKFIKKSKYQKKKDQNSSEKSQLKVKLSDIRHQERNFICPICLQYICCSLSVKCGHTFCEMCFVEYELLFNKCLVCEANIKNQEQRQCFLLDNLIQEFIERNDKTELEAYNKRKQECSQWRQKRQLNDWQIGQKIDIRDSKNIWCVGIISRIQPNKLNQAQNVVVCYINNLNVQEELPCISQRLAPFGFFTSRKDIIHYDNSLNSSQLVIQLPSTNSDKLQKLYIA